MRSVYSSYNNSTTATTTNSYQQDKDKLNTFMDKMKKSIESGDYESAKALLEESNKLIESNTNKKRSTKIAQQQAEFKSQLDTLSDTFDKQDKKSALETIAKIKDELKNNKNLVLKMHSSSDIVAEMRSQFFLSVYA